MAYDPINEYQNMLIRYNQGSATIGQMREATSKMRNATYVHQSSAMEDYYRGTADSYRRQAEEQQAIMASNQQAVEGLLNTYSQRRRKNNPQNRNDPNYKDALDMSSFFDADGNAKAMDKMVKGFRKGRKFKEGEAVPVGHQMRQAAYDWLGAEKSYNEYVITSKEQRQYQETEAARHRIDAEARFNAIHQATLAGAMQSGTVYTGQTHTERPL